MCRLKEIFKSEKKSSVIQEIKEKLNVVINNEDSDFGNFINAVDHDYDLPPVVDCLMYFVTGQVSKNFAKFTKCEVCRNGFFYSKENTGLLDNYNPIARIVTLNQTEQQEIQHPNKHLFNFIKKIEEAFSKHCK